MAQSRQILFVVAILVLALCQYSDAGRIRHQSNRVKRLGLNPTAPIPVANNIWLVEDQQEPTCIDVLANDYDVNGDLNEMTLDISSSASHGVVTINEENLVCYLPNPDFHGSDSFKYEICDQTDLNQCNEGLVRVDVSAVNDAPELTDDTVTVDEDEYSVIVDVLANDKDIDGRYIRRSTFKVVVPPKYGRYFVTSDKKIKYTPIFTDKARSIKTDELTYEVCDNEYTSLCSHAKLTILVKPKCLACEKCADTVPGFNLHVDRVHHFYDQDVLSVKH